MKGATKELIDLLATGQFEEAELWTFTFSGGVVARYTASDIDVQLGGQKFARGPLFQRGSISDKIGTETSTLTLTMTFGDDDKINGVPWFDFINGRGLDGANLKLERAFLPSWVSPVTGAVIRFAGKITSVGDIKGDSVVLTVTSWAILLNVSMPPDVYQSGCMHTLYDKGCRVDKASYRTSGTVSVAATTADPDRFGLNQSKAAGFLAQGYIEFKTGANTGVKRSIRSNGVDGFVTVVYPFPSLPAVGDQFDVYPGCDLTHPTCGTKFNNKIHFKGTPFVPIPETAI